MKPSVLIIDDSITVRMDLKESFDAAGFETTLCATIEAARDACRRQSFDLAILDVLLPDGDGLDFLQELKSSPVTAGRPRPAASGFVRRVHPTDGGRGRPPLMARKPVLHGVA